LAGVLSQKEAQILKIALAQISSYLGNVKANFEKHLENVNRAIAERADVIVFPELSLTGYLLKDLAYELAEPSMRELRRLAEHSGEIAIIIGFIEEWRRGIYRNSMAILSGGSLRAVVPKLYLPTYGLFEEKRYFKEGDVGDLRIIKLSSANVGIVICEDAWHPEPIEALSRLGADIIFVTAGSPARAFYETPTGKLPIQDSWEKTICTRALENNVFVAFINKAGGEDEEFFWGGSMLASPFGVIVAQAKLMDEDLLFYDVDLNEITRARRFSSFRDHRRELHDLLAKLP
jgi:predicted amidohydrolase